MLGLTTPVFVRHTDTSPREIHADQTSVRVLERSRDLHNSVSGLGQVLLLQLSRLEQHVRIQQKAIRILQVPALLLEVRVGTLETDRAVVSKVLPRLLGHATNPSLQELLGDFECGVG